MVGTGSHPPVLTPATREAGKEGLHCHNWLMSVTIPSPGLVHWYPDDILKEVGYDLGYIATVPAAQHPRGMPLTPPRAL